MAVFLKTEVTNFEDYILLNRIQHESLPWTFKLSHIMQNLTVFGTYLMNYNKKKIKILFFKIHI